MLRFSEDDDEAGVDDDDDDDDVDDVDDVKIVVRPKHFTAIAKSHRQVAAALEAKEVLICFQLSRVFSRQRTILHRIHGHGIFTILYLHLPQVFAKCRSKFDMSSQQPRRCFEMSWWGSLEAK